MMIQLKSQFSDLFSYLCDVMKIYSIFNVYFEGKKIISPFFSLVVIQMRAKVQKTLKCFIFRLRKTCEAKNIYFLFVFNSIKEFLFHFKNLPKNKRISLN